MKVGDHAEVSRAFSMADLQDYSTLSGHELVQSRVPEPLIGALFSYLLGVCLPGEGTMYLKQATRYLYTVPIGEILNARVEISRLRPDKELVDLSTSCLDSNARLVATGRALVYVGDVPRGMQPGV